MNINEMCLLKFLFNPNELTDMTDIIIKNVEEIKTNFSEDDKYLSKIV